jgi:hypothetical protein
MSLDSFESENVPQVAKEIERDDIPVVNKIDISKEEFIELNKKHSEMWIRDWIVDTVRKNNIPPPYTPFTEEEVREDFKKLCEFDTAKLISHEDYYIKHPIEDKWDKPMGIMWKMNNTGNKASNYFHQKARFKADSSVAYGVDFTWNNNKLLRRTINAIWTLKMDRINYTTLQQAFQLRGYIPSQFKPVIAKGIYDMFEAENAYDMSMGWGDRLAGFISSKCADYYYGTDPNKATFPNYLKQIEFYNRPEVKTDIHNLPAESLETPPDRHIDLCFSSPPYFSKEKYSEDKNQSYKKFPVFKDWLEKFLFEAIKPQWKALRKDGVLIVNISDVFIDGDWNVICDPMNRFISGLDGAVYMGHMGMKMAKRPNVKSGQDGNFAEPMWVWKKQ